MGFGFCLYKLLDKLRGKTCYTFNNSEIFIPFRHKDLLKNRPDFMSQVSLLRRNQFSGSLIMPKPMLWGKTWEDSHVRSLTLHDQISNQIGSDGIARGAIGSRSLFVQEIQSPLHPAAALRNFSASAVFQHRLPGHCRAIARMVGPAQRVGTEGSSAFHHAAKSPGTLFKKENIDGLLDSIVELAYTLGLIEPAAEGSVDATGFESSYVSRYFLRRSGRCKRYRPWTKLILACEHRSHIIGGMVVSTQPCNDAKYFPETVVQAAGRIRLEFLACDGAGDAESFHKLCREGLGIRLTAIPINSRGHTRPVVKGRYRKQMLLHFPRGRYGQRWQIESAISRLKRLLGPALRARTDETRVTELFLKVLTYDLMILRRCA